MKLYTMRFCRNFITRSVSEAVLRYEIFLAYASGYLGWLVLIVMTFLPSGILAGATPAVNASGRDRLLQQALEAYSAAMNTPNRDQRLQRFALAEQLFRQIMTGSGQHEGVRSAALYLNLGNAALQAELTEITTGMESLYGKGTYCSDKRGGECLDLGTMGTILAESRDPAELLDLWTGWRTVSPPIRPMYERFAELVNAGAQELGFSDLGELWRSNYDLDPDAFAVEVDRLWDQVRPLYEALHCHVRAKLSTTYGSDAVALDEPIPAHLLGNMWSQSWGNIYDLVSPGSSDPGFDLTEILRRRGIDEREMVRYGERFFTSLGFEPLPDTFWERSLFTKPQDRDVVCHASAWDIDSVDDLRIKMCIKIDSEDFVTVHHELGHNFYQRAYNRQSPLHQASAHDGFHEGVGDTVALSITPESTGTGSSPPCSLDFARRSSSDTGRPPAPASTSAFCNCWPRIPWHAWSKPSPTGISTRS